MPWDAEKHLPYGAYKFFLLPPRKLKEESHFLYPQLVQLKNDYLKKKKPQAQIALEFFLLFYMQRAGEPHKERLLKKLPHHDYVSFLSKVRFYRIPDSIRITLRNWLLKKWKILLLDYNPSSYKMLKFQTKGIRIVTIDWECALKGEYVFGLRDAFEHFLHDLDHCYNFFSDEQNYHGQISFFRFLFQFYPEIEEVLHIDPSFQKKWEYVVSDMNSHPAHLKAYTRAILYELQKEAAWEKVSGATKEKILYLLQKSEELP